MEIQGRRTRSAASQPAGSVSEKAGSSGGGGGGRSRTQQPKGSVTTTDDSSQASKGVVEIEVEEDESSSGSDNDEGEEYGDMHRLVLQGVMSAGYLDAKGVKKLFEETCRFLQCKVPMAEHLSPPFIQKVVREINKRVNNFDMCIRSATCEITGGKYYVCLVTMEKQIMKLQTFFTKLELDVFQKIIIAVLRNHNDFLISINECINMGADLDSKFSKVAAEDFVNKMISLQYLAKVFKSSQEFELTLGFRTIREFETIFRESFSECFGTCSLCKMILLNGLNCPKCPTVYHRGCFRKYIKNCKTCVECKAQWKNESSLPIRTMDGSGGKPPASTPKTSKESSSSTSVTPSQRTGAESLASNTTGDDSDIQTLVSRVSLESATGRGSETGGKDDPTPSSSKGSSENSTSSSSKRGKRAPVQRIDSSSDSD